MTRPPVTDAPACPVTRGTVLLRAIVLLGLAACTLLLVFGPTRDGIPPAHGDRLALMSSSAGSDIARIPGGAVAPTDAETDGGAGEPAAADPLPRPLPRLSGTGFPPREPVIADTWDSNPPHRPPRHA